MKYLLIIPLLITTLSTNAEIITDGTLGQNINLSGPDFQITPDLGQQHGGNLFHSFQNFNLNSLESATFSGSNNVQNILSRVTGGNPSNIDGLIRSTIPNADFYFLNPYGIIFGPNARLDVQGSFHASTADYLRLGENGRFDAHNLNNSLLTVAPIASFGFLTDSQSKLTINNSILSSDKNLSIISNDININQAKLTANHLNLTAERNIDINDSLLDSNTIDMKANNISLQSGTTVNASGEQANINLHANDTILAVGENSEQATTIQITSGNNANISLTATKIIFKEGAYIFSETSDNNDGSDITLNAKSILFTTAGSQFNGISTGITINTLGEKDDAGRGGNLLINAENLTLQDYAEFAIATHGKAQGGNTTLKVNSLLLLKNSMIIAFTTSVGDSGTITANITDHLNTQTGAIYNLAVPGSEGNAGKIIINAKNISLEKGSYILANSFGPGRAGDITVHASETIKIFGPDTESGWASAIASSSNLQQRGIKGGDAGNIIITANKLMMQDGGQITSSSIAPNGVISGKGGNIAINIQDTVEISGVNPHGENEDGFSSGIYARSIGIEDNSDDSGKISIQAGSLLITAGGIIISSTNNYADSGEIEIVVKNTIDINGDSNSIQLQEPLSSQLRYLSDFSPTDYNQATSGIYASSKSDNAKAGKAGSIRIHADQIILSNKGQISTSTAGGGNAGNISINVNKIQMDTSANISSSSLLENNFVTGTLVSKGDIIEVMDVGNQKSGRYVNNGNSRIKITAPVYKVADMQTLNNLSNQYDLIEGQVITVENIGNGESAHFIYVVSNEYKLEKWEQIPDVATTVLETDEVLNKLYFKSYSPDEQLPFKTGERIKVKDMGDGKPADFIFTALNSESGNIRTIALKINQFVFNDIAEMNGITSSLQDYPTALVADSGQEFIYSEGKWQVMDNVHKVNNINAMDNLTFTKVGNIMQGKIYTGEKWIPLNNSEHITVANLDELYQIKAKDGDLIDVDNLNGRNEYFFYANGKWIQQIKGGDAGQVMIIADNIQLYNSEISTESVSAGGGSIVINTNDLMFLSNGKITASVKEGAGDGGNLAISKPKFIINNGQIIAQAFEGNGGNISLASKQIISSPNSIISASSKLGLDGEVNINSPDMDMAGFLVILSDDYVDVSNQIKKPCSMRDSSFFVHKINGSPLAPYDYQPSTYLPETNGEVTKVSINPEEKRASSTCKNF